ncbi:MAG: 50S ribosomal protein L32e [Candidatus Woesearchaeota archaeon]
MSLKELLQKRKLLKKKKPHFSMQDSHKKKKLESKWRKPRGSDSKMRVSRRGYRRSVRIGWGSPLAVKGLDAEGLMPLAVNNVSDLDKADPKKHVIVLSSGIGIKKRIELIQKALNQKFKISNYKDPAKFIEDMKAGFQEKKKQKEKLKETRDKKKEETKKEAEKAKAKEAKEKAEDKAEEITEVDKKAEEKKEKDKILISTQQ